MESLKSVWAKLDARRRMVVLGATLAMFGAIALMARGPGPGEMALLYAGLDAAAAGEVVAALEARGTLYEVRGDAIFVPESARDEERMALAAEGLPASGAQGYELLDSLSGFGTTAQMFDAAYWRAKEGELARTILAAPYVRSARVHISAGSGRPFRREDRPTAAVTVTTRGAPLTPHQAQALRHLVAAAVSGMSHQDVAVIDGATGLVPLDDDTAPDGRAEELRGRAERLLEARVGLGNAVVEVSVDAVTETERVTERTFDPESRVAISTEVEESESASQGPAGGGAVTVASNLPDGEAAGGAPGGSPSSDESDSRTLTNYEVGETSREVVREPGAVRRLTVAVLVNDVPVPDAEGVVTLTPRPAEELAALSELVASAVGLDPARGDVITVKSMPFQPAAADGSDPAAAGGEPFDIMALVKPALLALVAIVLGLFVVRPILRTGRAGAALPPALPAPADGPDGDGAFNFLGAGPGGFAASGFGGSGFGENGPAGFAGPMGMGGFDGPGADGSGGLLTMGGGGEDDDPVARLRRLIESRQDETAQILQSWIDDAPKAARERA